MVVDATAAVVTGTAAAVVGAGVVVVTATAGIVCTVEPGAGAGFTDSSVVDRPKTRYKTKPNAIGTRTETSTRRLSIRPATPAGCGH